MSSPGTAKIEVLHAPDAEVRQRRAAAALLARGCTEGDRVAFALGSSADLICAVLGAARVGLIPVLLNATLTPVERDALADDAQPVVRVFDSGSLAALTAADDTAGVELAPYPLTRPMHYTSGTTGRPKGVTTGLWDDPTARAVYEDEAGVWHFDPSDLHLVCSPMYHTVSIRFSTNTLLAGGSLAILSRFDAGTALDTLRRLRPTTAFLVPTHLQRILQAPGLGADETFDSLRLLAHAGAPCPESVKRATMTRARPGVVWEFYGSTEAQYTVCSTDDWLEHPGTVGRARPGRRLSVAPIDDDDLVDEVPTDLVDEGEGAIWCDQPDFARFTYWRDPEATVHAWRGSACTVGDLGRLDADGFLYLTGRRHDLIISGGVNVYPAEVENALAGLPGVQEVAVFGLPDEQWGPQGLCRLCARDRTSRCVGRAGAANRRIVPSGAVQTTEGLLRHEGTAPHRHRQADATCRARPSRPRGGVSRRPSRPNFLLWHIESEDRPPSRVNNNGDHPVGQKVFDAMVKPLGKAASE